MAFPAKQKTWTISYNNVISGASLNVMMGDYLFTVSQFFLANGYTCKGSCDGVTGAMDGVNRWAAAANCQTRGATTGAANSWMVMTDGNGADILLSYVGDSDDDAYLAWSPGGLYVAAGTPAFTPTATDSIDICTNPQTVIGTTAAATNRNLFMWADSEAKLMRCSLYSNIVGQTPIGANWGVELIDSYLQDRSITPSMWGFFFAGAELNFGGGPSGGIQGIFSSNTRGGRTRVNGSLVTLGGGAQQFPAMGSFSAPWGNVQTELQGTVGYPIWGPIRIGSSTTNFTGIVAQLYDWWTCRYSNSNTTSPPGDTYDNLNFMAVGNAGGLLWPGDGVTTPVTGLTASTAQPGQHTGFENADDPAYGTFMDGASMYVPLANNVVTPTTPVAPRSIERRAGVQLIKLLEMPADPTVDPKTSQIYWRMINGQQALFCEYPDGTTYALGAG